ncbi:hypothetical protein [Alteromonas sp. 14N.309.X.WAT.G.H12]|uniref:hypothetical protein n=1 Tax=Alteromonas sp. 14N.309.X.WAT.G.H12 TaxID=3120824 RepID=UPI002FD06736
MSDRFYLACFRDTVGGNVAFHAKKGSYCTDVNKAKEYSLVEAQRAWDSGREFDQPLCADSVDRLTTYKVDCQHLVLASPTSKAAGKFVAYQNDRWLGNDVYWLSDDSPTVNFQRAKLFSKDEVGFLTSNLNVTLFPFDMVDKLKRPTFPMSAFTPRKMVQGAGLKQPYWLKQYKRRKPNTKSRWNCPSCGKFSWQYNPHDFDGCTQGCPNDYD